MGANVNCHDDISLKLACALNQIEIVKILLEHGAQVDEEAMNWATFNGFKEIEKLLEEWHHK